MRIESIIRGIAIIGVALAAGCGRSSLPPKPYEACSSLFNLAVQGCEMYKQSHGSWPGSLDDLYNYRDYLARKDAWGHNFGFTPYDSAKGYGELISYGQDGKPGGTGEDSDIVIRFPVKENADWNRQQAVGIKLPAQMQKEGLSNWYEYYLH